MEVFRRLPHHRGRLVDDALGDEPRVEVDVIAHRVVAHVLDAADEHDVGSAHRDLACARGRGGERAGAHAIDGESGNRLREPREQRDVATEGQALVTDLCGRREDDVVDALGRQLRIAPQELAYDLDGHVVGTRAPEVAVLAGAAECRAHPVHVDDLAELPSHRQDDTSSVVDAGKEHWQERARRAQERYEDGAARLPDDGDERQRQLTRMGNAAWAAGLSYLMLEREHDADEWLARAAERYRESWPDAPAGSWGRPIGAMKSRLLAGDQERAREDATWALDAGAAESESPIGRYAAALAALVLGEDARAAELAGSIQGRADFPGAVADALASVAAADREGYDEAIRTLLADFESRTDFLEDVPVADTVLVLQHLGRARGIDVPLESPLLPG